MRRNWFLPMATAAIVLFSGLNVCSTPAWGAPCGLAATATLYGTADVATLAGQGTSKCPSEGLSLTGVKQQLQPYFTSEIVCSTDRQAATEGLCSTTPCSNRGQFFAFRTIHRPDGSSGPAGFSCVSLEQAVATPGVAVAQVFEAVRRVRLPGGEIGVEPGVRGLANLESFFWVEGVEQSPVDLEVGGSRVHAEFRVLEYRRGTAGDEGAGESGVGE